MRRPASGRPGRASLTIDAIERRMAELESAAMTAAWRGADGMVSAVSGCRYIVAVDSAGGGEEGDFAAVQVIDRDTGLQCAELQERLRPSELAKVAVDLAKEYDGALIAVERNNHGAAVLAFIEASEGYAQCVSAKQRGRVVDDGSLEAGDGRAAGISAGAVAGDVSEQEIAGRVQDVCGRRARKDGSGQRSA